MPIRTDSSRRIVLFEYTCSGGLLDSHGTCCAESLMREGWAMLDALAVDLAALHHVEVQVLVDHHGLPGALGGCEIISVRTADEGRSALCHLAAEADWTIVIAPEFDGILRDLCQVVRESGGRLLGPSPELVELLSDKQCATVEHLERRGVPTPAGCLWRPGDIAPNLRPPLVVKPNDGAGSQETHVCRDREALERILRSYRQPARIEPYVGGLPASVSFLCGPRGAYALQPCRQRLTEIDGRISFCGGSTPLDEQFEHRATALARRATDSLSETLGYIGIDLMLGEDAGSADDCIIEINPRLTTSYIGLRAAARTNLAMAMLDVAEGRPPSLSFKSEDIEFDADGTVRAR